MYVSKERNSNGIGSMCDLDCDFGNIDREVVKMKCDELKQVENPIEWGLYYNKSEADKVIAELNRQIEFLKVTTGSCKECVRCADGMGKVFDKELDKLKDKLRYQKYKRCLDKASSCSDKASAEYAASYVSCDEYYYHHAEFWNKWHKRWLEFAEKFKPNNEVKNA